jgi:CRP-like cAMP-binding protein
VHLSEEEGRWILQAFQKKELKKKAFLLQEGEPSSHMRYIEKGCLRSFYLDEEGKEHIQQFGIEDWWINDLYAYLTQTPARQYIQALEPSVVWQVHRDHLEALFVQVPALERFYRIKMQRAYVASQERNMNTLYQTAEERYLHFRQQYRAIEQRVPQYMVASFLGITPEHLSAIRKK